MTIDTVSYEEIDRLFYEKLRRAVVAAGLTVDIEAHGTSSSYQNARDSLRASLESAGKNLVDVIGVGAWDDRQETKDARILINRMGESEGSIGGSPVFFFDDYMNGGQPKWNKFRYPDSSENIDYEIRLVTNNLTVERLLVKVIKNVLGTRRYLSTVDSSGVFTDKQVLVLSQGSFNLTSKDYIERAFRYMVQDVFVQEPELIASNIPTLSTVEFSLSLSDTGPSVDMSLDVSVPVISPARTLPFSLPFNL